MFAWRCFKAFLCAVPAARALYEDEAGQYEWFQQQLGAPTALAYSAEAPDRVFVASAAGAVGSLSLKDGGLQWRRIGEEGGKVKFLRIGWMGKGRVLLSATESGLVQAWKDSTGDLTWQREYPDAVVDLFSAGAKKSSAVIVRESSLEVRSMAGKHEWSVQAGDSAGARFWAATPSEDEAVICALATGRGKGASVVKIDAASGSVLSEAEASTEVENALKSGSFEVAGSNLVFLVGQTVSVVPVCGGSAGDSLDLTGKSKGNGLFKLMPWQQTPGVFAATDGTITAILGATPKLKLLRTFEGVAVVGPVHTAHDDEAGQPVAVAVLQPEGTQIQLMDPASGNVQPAIHAKGYSGADHGQARLLLVRELSSGEHRTVISAADESIAVLEGSKVAWIREESMASVRHALFYGRDAAASAAHRVKKESDSGIASLVAQLSTLPTVVAELAVLPAQMVASVKEMIEELQSGKKQHQQQQARTTHTTKPSSSEELRRFGGDKFVIAATASSKIIAMEATTGEIIWSQYLGNDNSVSSSCSGIAASRGGCHLWITLLPSASAPSSELLVVTAPSPQQEFIWVNPLTGAIIHREPTAGKANVASVFPVPVAEGVTITPFIYVDTEHNVFSMQKGGNQEKLLAEHADRLFHYEVDRAAQDVKGFAISGIESKKRLTPIWNFELASVGETIVGAAAPSHREWDHVPVHIKGDASILYKYVNPNLLAVASEDHAGKGGQTSLNMYLIDTVTGHVLHQSRVVGGSGPVKMTLCDNWAVMHYWNQKMTRYEITVVELFESKADDGPWNILFGGKTGNQSKSAHYLEPPVALQQTYILPSGVTSLGVTATLKGITPRSLIMALTTDHVFRVSKDMLNPRRPMPNAAGTGLDKSSLPTQFAPTKEEAVMPYAPVMPVKPTDVLTHYNPVTQVAGIISSPTALESTSLVFCYGLDLFFTPVQTARAYDVLSPGFNYTLLYASVGLVFTLVVATTYYAQYRALQDRWK